MIAPELLEILCCPETHQKLRIAEASLLDQLDQQIATGMLRNRAGRKLNEKLEGGLIRADGKFIYPIQHNIPVMLAGEAIALGD